MLPKTALPRYRLACSIILSYTVQEGIMFSVDGL